MISNISSGSSSTQLVHGTRQTASVFLSVETPVPSYSKNIL